MTNDHALKLLEFARVREDVAGYCLSEEGRDLLLGELPRDRPEEVAAIKAAVADLLGLFREGEEPPALSFPGIGLAAKRISKAGSSLELEELYALGLWSESFAAFAAYLGKALPTPRREALEALRAARLKAQSAPRPAAAPRGSLADQARGANVTVERHGPKVGRNDPCPCGSGKKYKHCHGA